MVPTWSALFDDDEELGELLDSVFSAGRVGRRAALGMRRRAAAAAIIAGKGGQGPQGKKHKGTPFSWPKHVMRLDESQFKRLPPLVDVVQQAARHAGRGLEGGES